MMSCDLSWIWKWLPLASWKSADEAFSMAFRNFPAYHVDFFLPQIYTCSFALCAWSSVIFSFLTGGKNLAARKVQVGVGVFSELFSQVCGLYFYLYMFVNGVTPFLLQNNLFLAVGSLCWNCSESRLRFPEVSFGKRDTPTKVQTV